MNVIFSGFSERTVFDIYYADKEALEPEKADFNEICE